MLLAGLVARMDGKKKRLNEEITKEYQLVQKPALFNGYLRAYQSYAVNEEGVRGEDTVPTESQMVQARYQEILAKVRGYWTDLFDSMYQIDLGNCQAKGDININDDKSATGAQALAADVPVSTLLQLSTKWVDFVTFLSKLPTPDSSVEWEFDPNQGLLRSKTDQVQQRTKKVMKALELTKATDRHAATAQAYSEDVPVGEFKRTAFCGGCPQSIKDELVRRASLVLDAIRVARESANNNVDAPDARIADKLFRFVFEPLAKTNKAA